MNSQVEDQYNDEFQNDQSPEKQHPNHPDEDLQEEDDNEDNVIQQEFFQIIDIEEFTNIDSQTQTHLENDLQAKISGGFFFSFLIFQIPSAKKVPGQNSMTSIIQTGSTARKNIQLQLNKDNFFVLTYRIGKQKSQLFSQVKLKPRTPTHIFLQLEQNFSQDEDDIHNSNSLTLHIDGVVQGQVALTKPIELPNQFIFVGSEQLPVFKGEIQDMVFGSRPLNQEEIKLVADEKLLDVDDQRSTFEILEEYKIANHKATQPQRKETQTAAQRHAIPQALSKTHITFIPKEEQPKQEMKDEEFQKFIMEQARQAVESLLLTNEPLNNKCRELSYAFKWVFNTLYMLSPPVEDKGGQCLPFDCLNSYIANDQCSNSDPFPYYGIELERFMKVLKYAKLPMSKDDVLNVGNTAGWLRKYKVKNNDNQIENIDAILYDKFLITVRDACMSEEEVKDIRRQCGGDPHETAPKEGDDIEFDTIEELFKLCKRNEIPEEEARKFQYKGLLVKSLPLKGGKPRICCSKDPRLLFYNKMFELYPDIKTNPDTVEKAYLGLSGGDEYVNLDGFTQFCIYSLKLWGEQAENEESQQQPGRLDNTHSRMNHNENLEECCKKLFNSFCFNPEPYFTYNEFVTLICSTYPCAIYEHPETGKQLEVTPYSGIPQSIVWANSGEYIENDENQMLGEILYKNDEEVNFLSAQARILRKQSVRWSTRDIVQKKKWNQQGRSEPQFGKWEIDEEEYDFELDYNFSKKQKIMVEFLKDEEVIGKEKFLVQEIIGLDTLSTQQYQREWQAGQVSGNITISRQVSGTDGNQFLDYIFNGLKINLMTAIDWTASNLEVENPKSLHYFDEEKRIWSHYQQVIKILGDSIVQFDYDKKIPMFGFGATPNVAKKLGGTFDCFPMNGDAANPSVLGVQGMLDTYRECRDRIELSGSTFFSPILTKMTQLAALKNQTNYSVCVLLSDGIISESQDDLKPEDTPEIAKVMNLLVEASDKPISFVIIGLGKEDLSELDIFNHYKDISHSVTGKNPIRQNSQYINFTQDCKDREDLAEQVLTKIKSQITCYYKMHKVQPSNLSFLSDHKKTVMHVLHPELFVEKKKEEPVGKGKKKLGKKIKKVEEEEEKHEFQPQYVQVSEQDEQLLEEENPAQVKFHIQLTQTQPQNGDFYPIYKNEPLPEIKPEELNQTTSFYSQGKSMQGFKLIMNIRNQSVSEIPSDNFLTLNSVLIKQIAPIWKPEIEAYEFPSENQEDREVLPKPCEQWNQGKFMVNLQRCADCHSHNQTSWHDEADFAEKQNEFITIFKGIFPNMDILGNYEKPDMLEQFDIYIRGVGPVTDRDDQGRIFIFRKEEELRRFLNNFNKRMLKPYDILVLLCSAYADSTEMEKVQQEFFKDNAHVLPKKWKNFTDGNCDVPERSKQIEEQRKKDEQIATGTKMICKNWGCGEEYEYTEDRTAAQYACTHHPGSYQMGSIHGLWPESWTCCRRSWGEPGCAKGFHRGQIAARETKLCLNRGEVNPITGRPDSLCGRQFLVDDPSECKIHTGYLNRKGVWSCCQGDEPCKEGTCQGASWPDEEAKLYFIEKPLVTDYRNEEVRTFRQTAKQACIYRETQPYKEFESVRTQRQKERIANDQENRICMHYGCTFKGKFKDCENRERKQLKKPNCWYHPGVFDFGRKESMDETCKWKPHWTCCIKPWGAKGCTKTYHWGPLASDFEANPPKNGKWPEVSVMKNFKQVGSTLWKKKLAEFEIDEDILGHIFMRYTKGEPTTNVNNVPELCDLLKLNLLVMSEDLSYLFKFMDVQSGRALTLIQGEGGDTEITKEQFSKWWFMPLEEYPVEFDQVSQ